MFPLYVYEPVAVVSQPPYVAWLIGVSTIVAKTIPLCVIGFNLKYKVPFDKSTSRAERPIWFTVTPALGNIWNLSLPNAFILLYSSVANCDENGTPLNPIRKSVDVMIPVEWTSPSSVASPSRCNSEPSTGMLCLWVTRALKVSSITHLVRTSHWLSQTSLPRQVRQHTRSHSFLIANII